MIKVTSRKFFSQWQNGDTFGSNLTDFATHLKGSIGERIKAVVQVEASLISVADQSTQFELINPGTVLRKTVGSWIDEGFQVGQTVSLISNYTGVSGSGSAAIDFTATIDTLTATELTFTTTSGTATVGYKTDHALVCTDKFGALMYQYGMIENSEAVDFTSPYTNDIQGYYFGSIDTSVPTVHNMTPNQVGSNSHNSGNMTVKYVSSSNPFGLAVNYVHTYEITHEFVINPFWLETYEDNYINKTYPEDFQSAKSIKYISNYEFRTVLSNPNTTAKGEDTTMIGEVGWLNENYNGLINNYSANINYYDGAALQTSLLLKKKTKISGSITGSGFSNTSKVGLYFWYNAPIERYTLNNTSLQNAFLYDNKVLTMSGGAATYTGSSRIKSFKLTYISSTQIDYEAEIEFTSNEQTYINDLTVPVNNYFIGLQVGNSNGVDTCDKVMVQVDYNAFQINTDVEGLLAFSDQYLYPHNISTSGFGYTDYKGWKQDGALYKFSLNLNKLLNANLHALRFKVVAYNTVENTYFELQRFDFPINNVVEVNGATFKYQQLTIDSTRGFLLPTSSPFNKVYLNMDLPIGNNQKVNCQVGFKFDYRSWVKLPGADTIFYDNSKDSKGLGDDASRYSLNNDYVIKIFTEADIKQLTTNLTTYQDRSNTLEIYDYTKDGSSPANWSSSIATFDESGNNLNGAILKDNNTVMKVTWTPQSGSTSGFNSQWAIHRIEEFRTTTDFTIDEFSSIENPRLGNVLKPVVGSSLLKITDNGTNIVTECLIDYTKLTKTSFSLTARLGRTKTYGRYTGALEFKFLNTAKTEAIIFNGAKASGVQGTLANAMRLATLDSNHNVVSEVNISLNQSYYYQLPKIIVDHNEVINGKSVFYMVCNSGGESYVFRFTYNGTTFIQTVILNNPYALNMNNIKLDNKLNPNGRAYLWLGSSNLTNFRHLYYDGAAWQTTEFNVFDSGNGNTCKNPIDVLFSGDNVYILNQDDKTTATNQEKGKISVWSQTSGSVTNVTDRGTFSNYTFQYDMYRNDAGSNKVDGLGNAGDMAFGIGMEILTKDVNNNPTILMQHDASSDDSRHYSRIFPNTTSPSSSAHFTIQTPMAATNGEYAAPTQIQGKANATTKTTDLFYNTLPHLEVVSSNQFIAPFGTGYHHFIKFTINDWGGTQLNEWYTNTPNDPTFNFSSGLILTA